MQFVGDKPKRSDAKDCKSSCSWYPCEYCTAKGVKVNVSDNTMAKKKIEQQILLIEDQINQCQNEALSPERTQKLENLFSLKNELNKSVKALNRKSNILYPFSTMNSQNRTRRDILDIVTRIENGESLTIDESKGIKGRSVLLDVPNFNFVYDSPAEYMHLGCLGVIKRLVELTFSCGQKRQRNTTRKLSSTSLFNKLMLATKVTNEFSRRARSLDFSFFKAQEYRNLCLFFFPLVLECIEPYAKEITLWLNLVYMLRSSVIPSVEYSHISLDIVHNCCAEFYKLFEELLSIHNCTYNLHTLCSHLTEIRTHGPLTETSAFKFESFYGELRRSFVPGTCSPLKQIMKKIFLKKELGKHYCDNNISITNYETPMEANNLIYCYKNKQYFMYQVSDIHDDLITCNKIGQYPVYYQQTPNIDWSSVGVFKKGGISSNNTVLNSSEIAGKVLHVGKYLITCPFNVLNEK